MPADQALAVVEYLKNNPEAAKQAWQQAQMVMRTMPGAAQALTGQVRRAPGAWARSPRMRPSHASLAWAAPHPT
jgi:hypothetical protein